MDFEANNADCDGLCLKFMQLETFSIFLMHPE
jgi:hypothetical protein